MAEPNETSATPRPKAIYWVASLALAGALLYYSLRGIDWAGVWVIVRRAQPGVVAIAVTILSFNQFMRSVRWRVLLSAEGRVSVLLAFWATSVGYLGNNLLPARAGEVLRTLMVCRRTGMSKAFVLTTALAERVVDAVALITISAIVLLTLPAGPGWLAGAARPFAVIGLLGVAAIALLPAFEAFWFRFLAFIPIPDGLRDQVANILRQGLQGIRSFHDRGRLSRFLLLTVLIWCLDGTTTVIAARSIGVAISVPVAFLLVAGLGLGSALPSTPGYVGIYQFVAVTILTPFGLSRTDAIAYILLYQAISYVVVLLWGLIGFAQERKMPGAIVSEPL